MVYDYAYDKPTLVMATKGTLESEKFNMLFNKYNNHKTYLLPCIELADIIEQNDKRKIREYLDKNLEKYKNKVKNVVLGCTHYPLIKDEIQKVLGKVEFFEGSSRLAIHLKDVLKKSNMLEKHEGKVTFIDSNNSKEKERRFYNELLGG